MLSLNLRLVKRLLTSSIFFLGFVCPNLLLAQAENNFKSGYLLMSGSDTLHGFIQLTKESKLNQAVQFKTSLTDNKVQVFEPALVKGFVILGNSKSIEKPKSEAELAAKLFLPEAGPLTADNFSVQDKLVYAAKNITLNNQEKRMFLRVIILGEVSLYQVYNTSQQVQYFVQKGNSELYALLEINYLGMLKIVLTDCLKLSFDQKDSPDKYPLTLKSLTQIIATYNACAYPMAASVYNNLVKASKIKVSGGIKAGAVSSQLMYTPAVSASLAQSPSRNNPEIYTAKTGFSGGLFLQVNLNKRLSLQPEVLYIQKGGSVFKEIYTGTPALYRDFDQREFRMSYLQLPFMLKYQTNILFKPYLTAGILFGKELSRKIKVSYNREREDQPRAELPNPKAIEFQPSELGGLLGVGFQIPVTAKNAFTVEIRYEKTRLPKYSVGVLHVNTWQIQTGINLF